MINYSLFSERLETASRNLINENKLEAGLAFPTGNQTSYDKKITSYYCTVSILKITSLSSLW